ncbi:MAG TPA: hypothetical protein VJU80_16645 [Solirubrobacteraceae bacterium]|nr:hypothetical protein [Solirubrobacteraceae bacterium]
MGSGPEPSPTSWTLAIGARAVRVVVVECAVEAVRVVVEWLLWELPPHAASAAETSTAAIAHGHRTLAPPGDSGIPRGADIRVRW